MPKVTGESILPDKDLTQTGFSQS